MRKIFLMLAVLVVSILFTSCIRPYDKPSYVEVDTFETAFVIPLFENENVSMEDQVQVNGSEDYYKNHEVNTKLIQIPHKWVKTGRFARSGRYMDAVKVVKVSLSPISGKWLPNSEEAVKVETSSSQGMQFPITYSFQIEGINAAKYLSKYKDKSLEQVIKTDINRHFSGVLNEETHKREYTEVNAERDVIIGAAVASTKEYCERYGITVNYIRMYDGIVPDDASLQNNLNKIASIQTERQVEDENIKLLAKQKERIQAEQANKVLEAKTAALVAEAQSSNVVQTAKDREQERENRRIIAQAQADSIRASGANFKLPDTLIVTADQYEALGLGNYMGSFVPTN